MPRSSLPSRAVTSCGEDGCAHPGVLPYHGNRIPVAGRTGGRCRIGTTLVVTALAVDDSVTLKSASFATRKGRSSISREEYHGVPVRAEKEGLKSVLTGVQHHWRQRRIDEAARVRDGTRPYHPARGDRDRAPKAWREIQMTGGG